MHLRREQQVGYPIGYFEKFSKPKDRNRKSALEAAMGDPARWYFAPLLMRMALSRVLGQSRNLGMEE